MLLFSEMEITVAPKSKPQTSTHQRATDMQAGQSQSIYNNIEYNYIIILTIYR